jgi:hypothetical protein
MAGFELVDAGQTVAAARLARCSMPWLGCRGLPATNRSLPSLSALQAVTGVELGMVHIVPAGGEVR